MLFKIVCLPNIFCIFAVGNTAMTASDLINKYSGEVDNSVTGCSVSSDTSIIELPSLLAENDMLPLTVESEGRRVGIIDAVSLTAGMARMLPSRTDCSVIEVQCKPEQYSASLVANAVEDVDAHLLDLFTYPEQGMLHVLVRITHMNPSAAIRSLERYGFCFVNAFGSTNEDVELSNQRLEELMHYLNV